MIKTIGGIGFQKLALICFLASLSVVGCIGEENPGKGSKTGCDYNDETPVDVPDDNLAWFMRLFIPWSEVPGWEPYDKQPLTRGTLCRLEEINNNNPAQDDIYVYVISNLEGLQYAKNLKTISLHESNFTDLKPISKLTNLEHIGLSLDGISDLSYFLNLTGLKGLNLNNNAIEDISPLKNMIYLENMSLSHNKIVDISILSELDRITHLYLDDNLIEDISVLLEMDSLLYLDFRDNPLNQHSREMVIPELKKRVSVVYY